MRVDISDITILEYNPKWIFFQNELVLLKKYLQANRNDSLDSGRFKARRYVC